MPLEKIYGGAPARTEGDPFYAQRTVDADDIVNGPASGRQFEVSHTDLAVVADGTVEILVQVGTSISSIALTGSVSGQAVFSMFEAPTVTNVGTPALVTSHYRPSPLTPSFSATYAPIISADGDLLTSSFLPGGQRQQATGSITTGPLTWILAANTDYLLRMENISATTAAITIAFEIVDPGAV